MLSCHRLRQRLAPFNWLCKRNLEAANVPGLQNLQGEASLHIKTNGELRAHRPELGSDICKNCSTAFSTVEPAKLQVDQMSRLVAAVCCADGERDLSGTLSYDYVIYAALAVGLLFSSLFSSLSRNLNSALDLHEANYKLLQCLRECQKVRH